MTLPFPIVVRCLIAVVAVVLSSETHSGEPDSTKDEGIEFFEKQVRPLLVKHCYECHSGKKASGGLLLDSREHVRQGGDSGFAIISGDADASLLVQAVRYENRELQMPPEQRLTASEIAVLERWVAIGVPDPRDSAPTIATPLGMSIEDGRKFWSFQPIAVPAIPFINDTSRIQTPIDSFVFSKLEQVGLVPAPAADRATLIRRVTYDLLGLPPTIDEIEAFVSDKSPTAYRRLVERLLASEQYGVRWGRHWLDIARYADSNGLDENLAFGNAWRYRDYVVDAFNHDKPVDQFIIEQLAGDLVPDATRATKTATGFLMLGAKVLAEPDREKLEMDTIDEQLDTTGKALLGMTIGCARCHDHKFDPLKQTDYYALAAIIKSTKTFDGSSNGAIKFWNEHVFASDKELASIAEVDAIIAEKTKRASDFKTQAMDKLRQHARTLATEYLVAATLVDLEMSLRQVDEIAAARGLHPRILHHCRRHLHFNLDDPVFKPWHEFQGDKHAEAVRAFYEPLFRDGDSVGAAATADRELFKLAKAALADNSGFLAVPPKPEFAFDSATLAEYDRLMEDARIAESEAPDIPAAMSVCDGKITPSIPIHIRGSHLNLGELVARDFPAVMRDATAVTMLPEQQSGRLELARWIASPKHPLTARVFVNRLWRWHFGQGIVGSTDNFGSLGDRPTHPELLDYLATYFIQSGWSMKQLHRLILLSSVYQQQSQHPQESLAAATDPENLLLWKFRLQRLEAEQIHDSILASAGTLDLTVDGKTVPLRNRQFVFNHTSVDHTKYNSHRRAIYLPVIRNNLYSTFEQFDFPDPTTPTGSRNSTIIAPQVLLMMNAEMVIEAAETLAEQILSQASSDKSRIEEAFKRVLRRTPDELESSRAYLFIEQLTASHATVPTGTDTRAAKRAWTMFCQCLIASNEFVFLR